MERKYVVMSKALFDQRVWDKPFDTLLAQAERGDRGMEVLNLEHNSFHSRAGNAPLTYQKQLTDERGNKEWKHTVLRDVAVFYAGPSGQSCLHGQAW